MNRKLLAYSGILLLALVVTSVLVNRGVIQGDILDSEVTLTLSTLGQVDADGDSTIDGVPLGGKATLTGSIVIGDTTEDIESVEIEVARDGSNTATDPPAFAIRVQPQDSGTNFVKTFTSTSTDVTGDTDDGVVSGELPGDTTVTVTIDIDIFSTSPGTLPPSTLPSGFKGPNSTSAITYTIEWVNDVCSFPDDDPCDSSDNIAGDYDVTLTVTQPTGDPASATESVTIVEVDTVVLTVDDPDDDEGFGANDLADLDGDGLVDDITLSGSVNDGGVLAVVLGGTVSSEIKVGSPVAAPTDAFGLEISGDRDAVVTSRADADDDVEWLTTGLWHVTDESPPFGVDKPYEGDFGFYYGQDADNTSSNVFNYDTGSTNSGGLVSPRFTAASSTVVGFTTWYDTEFSGGFGGFDEKTLEWCPSVSSFDASACETIAFITPEDPSFFFDDFFGGFDPFGGDPFGGGGGGTEPGTVFFGSGSSDPASIFVPGFFHDDDGPITVAVELDLLEVAASSGVSISPDDEGYIRFFFDTKDPFANFFPGWFVDDVEISGPGTLEGVSFIVDDDLNWDGSYKPQEGANDISFSAQRTEYLVDADGGTLPAAVQETRTIYKDTVAPTGLAIEDPDLGSIEINPTVFVTTASTVGLSGEFDEAQPFTVSITKRTGTTTKPVTGDILDARFEASDSTEEFSLGSSGDFDPDGESQLSQNARPATLASTTLADAAIAGTSDLVVASVTGLEAGSYLQIDTKGLKEFKKISGISGTTITLTANLGASHASGATVAELQTIDVADSSDWETDQFITVDPGPSEEVRKIVLIETGTEGQNESARDTLALDAALASSHTSGKTVQGAEDRTWRTPSNNPLDISAEYTEFTVTVTDRGGATATTSVIILRDNTAPTGDARVVTITSDDEAVVGDQFFLIVAAEDGESEVDTVVEADSDDTLVDIDDVEDILVEMHQLGTVNSDTTHVNLSTVADGTPVGSNTISVEITDVAGNGATITATLEVVSARTHRNYFLFPGVNYVGLALVPDDTNDTFDELYTQDVTDLVSDELEATSTTVTLADIIETTFAFDAEVGGVAGFEAHTPGVTPNDLTDLEPFQGMIITTRTETTSSVDVFREASVSGFSALQAVPIKLNILGEFAETGAALPPSATLFPGYNLTAPHILDDATFDLVFRGALIPDELAVSAITFEREVIASAGDGTIDAEIFEGFSVASLGDLLSPVQSYWNFLVGGASVTITP